MTVELRMWCALVGLAGVVLGCGPTGPAGAQDDTGRVVPRLDAGERALPQYLQCLEDEGVALVSAHRGGPAQGFAENAIASFDRIASYGPALLEVDVRATADGVFVLLHDQTLDRTTTCSGSLDEILMVDIRQCGLRDIAGKDIGGHVPTLVEALMWADGRGVLQLDVKRLDDFPAIVEVVKQADAFDRVLFITYGVDTALAVADLHADVVVSTTIRETADLDVLDSAGLVDTGRVIGWVGFGTENPELVAELDARGVLANFGTLGFGDSIDDQIAASGDEARYGRIAASGVDIIATDRPVAALGALQAALDPAAGVVGCGVGVP